MMSAGTLLSRKYDAGDGVAARLQICPKAWCVGASNWPASGPRSIPRYRPRCWGSLSSGNTVKARVLSTVARERSRRRVIVLCISSKDAYRSSAGREAHCRLACIRVVIVLSFRLSRAGMPSTPCARTGAQPGGRSLSEATDGFGDVLMSLKLIHGLQAMTNGECPVSERAFRDHARDPLLLARRGTALQISGVSTQHPEHVRIIVHGSRPEMLGSRGLSLYLYIGIYSQNSSYTTVITTILWP